ISLKNNFLKTYFGNYNDLILLKNNLINLKYENKNLEVEGESNYSFNTLFDKIEYKIKKKNNNYNFITSINFDQNLLEIKPIEYSKEKKKKSNLEIKGTYNKNKSKFNEINYNEGKNFFIIRDLIVNNNLKILDFKRIELHYLNDNNKINEINIEKNLANYNLNGRSFDTYKLINKVLFSENENTFLDNFNFKKEIKLNISIDKIFLDNKNFSKNLFGDLIFKDNKIYAINLTSNFENNDKFKLLVKTLTNKQKITSFYSDYAEPFIKHFKFIKGFKEGKIDFYSVREDNVSNSTLNIFDFKVKEMPALTKLLSLASLQGIADIMTGEGIRFNEFEMNFSNKNKLMTINEIYALGPAISILMSGYIESSKLVSLRGTLVPATTLNKVIGSLPFIGKILVGKKTGEGVFGVSFKIKGPPKKS
ncbi:AsmA-like C-terminal region-containing protein, partial [Candidatus Pelagibacter sp.]|nr:AsmA-like C-terminal region-containing protein [Candidatus Pelagibacter sp.]